MKKLILAAIVILGFSNANAQQLPQYSQYLLNNFVLNPAVGGSEGRWIARSNHRYQWVGITDAPRTFIFSVNGPLNNKKVGLGGHLFTDVTGPTRRTGIQLSYAYHLTLSEKTKLSFGVSGGLLQFVVDGSKIIFREDGDQALSKGVQSVLVPDAGAGLYLYGERFFVSASAPQLINYRLQFFENYEETESKLVNHYFLSAGYQFPLGDDFEIEPSFLVKYVNPIRTQFDATLRFLYQDQIWVGGSYRTEDAIAMMIGYEFQNNLMIGYSYDLPTSNLRTYSNGSHEFMLGFRFKDRSGKKKNSTTSGE